MTGVSQWKEASPPSTFWLNLNNGSLHIGGTPPGPAGRCSLCLGYCRFQQQTPDYGRI